MPSFTMFQFPRWNWSYTSIKSTSTEEESLEDSESQGEKPNGSAHKHRSFRPVIKDIIAAISGFAVLGVIGYLALGSLRTNSQQNTPARLCGNSTSEALSLGCTFDQLMWAWYPPQCPHYANDEFVRTADWKYYLDLNRKEAVTSANLTEALSNEWEMWGQRGEHLTHCVYMFLSLGQILRDGTPSVPRLTEYEHLHHCSQILLDVIQKDERWDSIETHVPDADFDQTC